MMKIRKGNEINFVKIFHLEIAILYKEDYFGFCIVTKYCNKLVQLDGIKMTNDLYKCLLGRV